MRLFRRDDQTTTVMVATLLLLLTGLCHSSPARSTKLVTLQGGASAQGAPAEDATPDSNTGDLDSPINDNKNSVPVGSNQPPFPDRQPTSVPATTQEHLFDSDRTATGDRTANADRTASTPATRNRDPTPTATATASLLDHLAESSALFTWDAYHGMATPPNDNIFFSPYSLINALGMLAMGSGDGIARDQLLAALRVDPGLSDDALDRGVQLENARLRTDGKTSPGVTLLVANKFYVDRTRAAANINPEYLQNISDFYGASMQAVNFSLDLPGTVRLINGWVSDNTRGKITNLVSNDLDPRTQLILANAVYFDGRWNTPFSPELTFDGNFHRADGTDVRAKFMSQVGSLPYAEDESLGLSTIVLPYAGDSNITMHVVMPLEGHDLADLESKGSLDGKVLRSLARKAKDTLVQVSLPKFSLKHEMELSSLMKQLNATAVFHPLQNEFSNIFLNPRPGFFVNEILHQAVVEVDERGTVAAAATAIVGTRSSFPRTPVLINRPFLFYIADETNGFVLFWGRVGDPTKAN